jgi:hypothetical protein
MGETPFSFLSGSSLSAESIRPIIRLLQPLLLSNKGIWQVCQLWLLLKSRKILATVFKAI